MRRLGTGVVLVLAAAGCSDPPATNARPPAPAVASSAPRPPASPPPTVEPTPHRHSHILSRAAFGPQARDPFAEASRTSEPTEHDPAVPGVRAPHASIDELTLIGLALGAPGSPSHALFIDRDRRSHRIASGETFGRERARLAQVLGRSVEVELPDPDQGVQRREIQLPAF